MTWFKSLLEDYMKKDGLVVTYDDNGKRKKKVLEPSSAS